MKNSQEKKKKNIYFTQNSEISLSATKRKRKGKPDSNTKTSEIAKLCTKYFVLGTMPLGGKTVEVFL